MKLVGLKNTNWYLKNILLKILLSYKLFIQKGTDRMNLELSRKSKMPLYLQIKDQIKERIFKGELPAGFMLPPERKLADKLDVNRSTILNAYRELKAEGLVESRVGKGTLVMPYEDSHVSSLIQPKHPLAWQYLLSDEAYRFNDISIMEMLRLDGARQPVISFATGMADPSLYPIEDYFKLDMNKYAAFKALGHSPVEGHFELRDAIKQIQGEKGIQSKINEIMVLSGSQQGLDLIARCLLNPGDTVIVQEPTYIGTLHIFASAGVKVIGVPLDENGMHMDIVETMIKKHKPKLIYTVPTFQNPTGITMDINARIQLLNIAYTHQIPIIEDDAYGDLRYEGVSLPTLKALDQYGYVIYLNTFSKTLFPGIRVGWLCGQKEMVHQLAIKKQLNDLHTSSLSQVFLENYLKKGAFEQHLVEIRKKYKEKRDCMLDCFERNAPKGVEWTKPQGGLYIWCELPETVSASKLVISAKDKGIVFVPGTAFYSNKKGDSYLRLNFTYPSITEIKKGMKILFKLIQDESCHNVEIEAEDSTLYNPIY